MLSCKGCGSVLVSDGDNWFCPYRFNPNYHVGKDSAPFFRDARLNSVRERQRFNESR